MAKTPDARITVKELTEGDVIRVPQYKNALKVTHTGELNGEKNAYIGLEFVENPTSAEKSMIVNRHSGRVYLTAGMTDKGEVTVIEIVMSVEETKEDDEDDIDVLTDAANDEDDEDETDALDELQKVEGIGPKRARTLLEAFETLGGVSRAAGSSWGRIADLDGFSEDSARSLFHRMNDADVYDQYSAASMAESDAVEDDEDVEVPELVTDSGRDIYAREIEEREKVVDECPVDLYIGSYNPRWGYPHKLMSVHEARPGIRETCENLIIDSGATRHGHTADLLDAATRFEADYVVAPDITSETDLVDDGRPWRSTDTIDAVQHFISEYRDHACEATVIIPLQPPYARVYRGLKSIVEQFGHVAIGGLLSFRRPIDRVEAMREVRELVGDDVHIHALAPGTDPLVLDAIRSDPELVDSLDVSTPERAPANGKIPDATWTQQRHRFPTGVDVTTVRGTAASFIATQLNYMLGPNCADLETSHQQTFGKTNDREQGVLVTDGGSDEDDIDDLRRRCPNCGSRDVRKHPYGTYHCLECDALYTSGAMGATIHGPAQPPEDEDEDEDEDDERFDRTATIEAIRLPVGSGDVGFVFSTGESVEQAVKISSWSERVVDLVKERVPLSQFEHLPETPRRLDDRDPDETYRVTVATVLIDTSLDSTDDESFEIRYSNDVELVTDGGVALDSF